MGTYVYECHDCHHTTEMVQAIGELRDLELCPTCNKESMARVMQPIRSNVQVCQFDAAFNPAFGKVISSKLQLKEELARYKGEKGKELVEVGTDKMDHVKVRRTPYTY